MSLSGLTGLAGLSSVCGGAAAAPLDPETAAAVVAGSGVPLLNKRYPVDGTHNERNSYRNEDNKRIVFEGLYWGFFDELLAQTYYYSSETPQYPWECVVWETADADDPPPTVTMG